jgi:hypothetical protein
MEKKGTLTNNKYMTAVLERVKKMPEYKRAEAIIDYILPVNHYVKEITKYAFNFCATPNFGTTEGIYIHCYLQGEFDNTEKTYIEMGTIKTLHTSLEAMMIMGEFAGLLTFEAIKYINEQIWQGYFDQ